MIFGLTSNNIGGVMGRVLTTGVGDRGFESRSDIKINYIFGIVASFRSM